MLMPAPHPLAQLVDLLPDGGWVALFAVGMLAPVVATIISLETRRTSLWKQIAATIFYAISTPLAAMVFLVHTENPYVLCSFIILMPVGMILGLLVLVAGGGRLKPERGFEVDRQKGDAQ